MGELIRVSVSLKVDDADELYYALIQPLQQNRQLSSFIINILQAYKDDGDIHDLVDDYINNNTGVAKIKGHLQNLIDLQMKANRFTEDVNTSLGGTTESTIENIFDNDTSDNVPVEVQVNNQSGVAPEHKGKTTVQAESVSSTKVNAQALSQTPSQTPNNTPNTLAVTDTSQPPIIQSMLSRLTNVEQSIKVIQDTVTGATIVKPDVEKSVENVENGSNVSKGDTPIAVVSTENSTETLDSVSTKASGGVADGVSQDDTVGIGNDNSNNDNDTNDTSTQSVSQAYLNNMLEDLGIS